LEPMKRAESDKYSRPEVQRDGPVTGDFSRKQWIVPVYGLSGTDPDGTAQTIVRRDGTVILYLICGAAQTRVRLDASRAAQLCTGIWEAAQAAQQLTDSPDDHRLPPSPPDRAGNATRTIGPRIRQLRIARHKSLRVISGLAGMSLSTLWRIEHEQREPTPHRDRGPGQRPAGCSREIDYISCPHR